MWSHLDIYTQANLSEVEIVSLVQELIPRYRLRADTDFACSNEDFIQTPRIDGSEFDALTNTQIRALLDYYGKYAFSRLLTCSMICLFVWLIVSVLSSSRNDDKHLASTES